MERFFSVLVCDACSCQIILVKISMLELSLNDRLVCYYWGFRAWQIDPLVQNVGVFPGGHDLLEQFQ